MGSPKKCKAVVTGYLLLTLLFFMTLYYIAGRNDARSLSVVSGTPIGAQKTKYSPSEGNPNSFTEGNYLTVSKSVIKNSSVPQKQTVLKYSTVVNSTSVIRNIVEVSVKESGHAAMTELEKEPVPGDRHIIFLETSCVLNNSIPGKQSGLAITPRQACAVASAANTNPDTMIYLLHTCSIVGSLGDSPEFVKHMLSCGNVRIWKLVISDYIKGTPLETWDVMGKILSSRWPLSHASDILRFITLWKYGGTYLDMDFVFRK
jgi:hypothetical protein